MSMRIITGLYKGRSIRTVGDLSVRPATDRVRQTIFNMLANRMDFAEASVLDLFAGSGSLGLEALSRGAARAVFVESGREAAECLRATVKDFGCADSARVVCEDAGFFLQQGHDAYDLVFADPPYAFVGTADLPRRIFSAKLVRTGGYLLIEHAQGLAFASTDLYTAGPAKRFGRTIVTFFQEASS
jgi:16S rRNA (guanine966-N2)-methyltransferase